VKTDSTASDPKMTTTTRIALREFLDRPDVELYGMRIARNTGLPTGTLYPILIRLAAAGWLSSRREDIDECQESRPLRTYYRLTDEGRAKATDVLSHRPL